MLIGKAKKTSKHSTVGSQSMTQKSTGVDVRTQRKRLRLPLVIMCTEKISGLQSFGSSPLPVGTVTVNMTGSISKARNVLPADAAVLPAGTVSRHDAPND